MTYDKRIVTDPDRVVQLRPVDDQPPGGIEHVDRPGAAANKGVVRLIRLARLIVRIEKSDQVLSAVRVVLLEQSAA